MENTPERNAAKNVRHLRQDRGWSLAELSSELAAKGHSLSVGVLSKMELGDRGIGTNDLAALAAAFEVGLDILILDPGVLAEQRAQHLMQQYQAELHARAEAMASFDQRLEALENELLELYDGRPDLQVMIRGYRRDRLERSSATTKEAHDGER